MFDKLVIFFWLTENYIYIRKEFRKYNIKCPIAVFILAILIISFLGSKDCLWLFEIQETNKTNIQS